MIDRTAIDRHRCSTVQRSSMRIAIDIDSTLHHYWDVLSEAARRRFGIELPYEEQLTWGVTRLRPEQLELCISETHGDEEIVAARPYPGAVETVRRWHEAGHFIHITSHRAVGAQAATERWLHKIGLPFDELYCSYDKVSRCVEIEIDMLVDDSPLNLTRAIEQGIVAATIRHPWNRDVCEEENEIIAADDWPELERRLAGLTGVEPVG
ncbi:MAG TPA: hypothetical protein VGN69_08815 [Solirubrobacteraceae bacterium]|nr:hypothetical protein [Solirubrobacteraceae bacterium]